MKKNNGGPVFPVEIEFENKFWSGMYLRDYFAGQALAGCCQHEEFDQGAENIMAEWCYEIADAMLKEREKQREGRDENS